jgi:hypothetical protein
LRAIKTNFIVSSHVTQPQVQSGFVGFFDVLGFRAVLANGITEAATDVLRILRGIKNGRLQHDQKSRLGAFQPGLESLCNQIDLLNYAVFADSILVTYPCPEDANDLQIQQASLTTLSACCLLQTRMFDAGLPMRGAISFGKYCIEDHCFIGAPINDAHELEGSLEIAACVLDSSAEEIVKRASLDRDEDFVVRYFVPTKKDSEEMLCLNPAYGPAASGLVSDQMRDLREYIFDAFSKHGKRMNEGAITKLNNTENYFRFIRSRCPQLFGRE